MNRIDELYNITLQLRCPRCNSNITSFVRTRNVLQRTMRFHTNCHGRSFFIELTDEYLDSAENIDVIQTDLLTKLASLIIRDVYVRSPASAISAVLSTKKEAKSKPKLKVSDLLEDLEKSQDVKKRVLDQIHKRVDNRSRYSPSASVSPSVGISYSPSLSGAAETSESVSPSPTTTASPGVDEDDTWYPKSRHYTKR